MIQQSAGAAHGMIPAIDMQDLAGDAVAVVAKQESTGSSHLFVADVATQRRHVFVEG